MADSPRCEAHLSAVGRDVVASVQALCDDARMQALPACREVRDSLTAQGARGR